MLWAFGYNSIGLALAVSGHLQPVMAAVLMAGSSLLVVLNSLRLERFAAPSDHPRPEGAPAAEPRVLDQAVEGEVDAAAGIAEIGAAGGPVDLAELLLQGVDQAPELGLEAAVVRACPSGPGPG